MRVIKEGKIPPPEERIKTCFICDTKMAYKEEDIRFDMVFEKYIVCPVCNQRLYPSIFDKKVKK